MFCSDSPETPEMSSGPETLNRGNPVSPAMQLAKSVFPQPAKYGQDTISSPDCASHSAKRERVGAGWVVRLDGAYFHWMAGPVFLTWRAVEKHASRW